MVAICFLRGNIYGGRGGQSLRQAADGAGLLVGTAVRPSLLSETAYAKTLAGEVNMVEPEDAMKWPALQPDASSFDFRQGDEVVRFAQAHQMKVRGHCLVWDHDNPDWLTKNHYTTRQLSRILREHITRVMGHFAGQVFAWDVINEATDENEGFAIPSGTTNPVSDFHEGKPHTSSMFFAGRVKPIRAHCFSITKPRAKA